MERVQKQNGESENSRNTAQAKFTAWSRENERADGINDSPAMVAQRKKLDSLFGGAIQRQGDEEDVQMKRETAQRLEDEEAIQPKAATAQREEAEELLQPKVAQREEAEELMQPKAIQREEAEEPIQGKFEAASSAQLKKEAAKPNNTGLPDNLKSGIESLSGMSMDNVKVHYNSSQPAQLNALAYAQGTDIHVAPGQEQHLPHEAWHVVQQAQGRVQPTTQMKEGVPVNDDKSLEHEADVMGARAVQKMGGKEVKEVKEVPITFNSEIAQPKIDMKARGTQKRNLTKVRNKLRNALPNRRATVEEIAMHDSAQNAGHHHPDRNVTLNQLISDINTTLATLTQYNERDSDALGVEKKAGRGAGAVAVQLKTIDAD